MLKANVVRRDIIVLSDNRNPGWEPVLRYRDKASELVLAVEKSTDIVNEYCVRYGRSVIKTFRALDDAREVVESLAHVRFPDRFKLIFPVQA